MSKKRKTARRRYIARARDNASVISSARALRAFSSAPVMSTLRLLPLGDGRFFNPAPVIHRPFVAAPRAAARLVAKKSGLTGIQFADPTRVLVCVRRKVRKEVMFALGVGGSGGAKKRPRRTSASSISC